jgi:nucleoside-diphosphate-sugar epimerase
VILVTGGLGMIGAHTALALVEQGHEVVVTSHHRAELPSFLDGRVTVEPLDITDREAFLAVADRYEITEVVHLAGSMPGPDRVDFFRTQMAGLLSALEAASTWKVRRFAVASSLGVYTGRKEIPWREELALPSAPPAHPIAAFKKALEPLVQNALKGSGVQPVLLRLGSIWGPLYDPRSPFEGIATYVSTVLDGDEPKPVYADDGGDGCYAPDAGRAIALLTTAEELPHTVYNVSRGRPYRNEEMLDALHALGLATDLQALPGRQNGAGQDHYLDISRLTKDTGFTPRYDIAAAVADYVDWRAANPR